MHAIKPLPRWSRVEYKWKALSVTTVGSAMAAIDSSIVILAFPSILADLHSDLVSMVWVLMGYTLMATVFLTLFGRLADIFGRVKLYNLGFIVFTVGSVLCAIATTGLELIVFRFVQGAGGAMLMANSMAILTEAFPAGERGRAIGYNAITWAIGSIAGPVFGGVILAIASWRWIFLVNLPIGIAGTAWGFLTLHELSRPQRQERLDFPGTALLSGGLICLLVALTESVSWGWTSPRILLLFFGFGLLEAVFYAWERRTAYPLIDLDLFRSRIYSFTIVATTLESLAMFAVNFLVIFYLQGVKGINPLTTAVMVLPFAVAQSVVGPIGGIVSDMVGARIPATLGLVLQGIACLLLASLTPVSSYPVLFAGMLILGIGAGLVWSAQTSAVMGAAPIRRLGIASATLATFRQCGMVTSFALALATAAATLPKQLAGAIFLGTSSSLGGPVMAAFTGGMQHALFVSFGIVLVAACMTVAAGDTARTRQDVVRAAAAHGQNGATAEAASDREASSIS